MTPDAKAAIIAAYLAAVSRQHGEKVRAGMAAARAAGVRLGRPRSVDSARLAALRAAGLSCREAAAEVGVSASTAWRAGKH